MSGRRKNKRRRCTSNAKERRSNEQNKTDDDEKQLKFQRTKNCQNPSTSSVNIQVTKEATSDAKGGHSLRPRINVPTHSEDEDEPKDESWVPGAMAKKRRMEKVIERRLKAARVLNCTDQSMLAFFTEHRIPVYLDHSVPKECTETHVHNDTCKALMKRIYASNVTRANLMLHGRWEFHDGDKYLPAEEDLEITAQDIYVELTLDPSPVPRTAQPFKGASKGADGRFRIPNDHKPDRNIREAVWWVRHRLNPSRLLPQKFPLEWTIKDDSAPKIRPELPSAFVQLLKQQAPTREVPPSPFSSSSLAATPVKRHGIRAGASLHQDEKVRPLRLDTIQEQVELSSVPPDDMGGNKDISHSSQLASAKFELPRFSLDLSHPNLHVSMNGAIGGDEDDHWKLSETPSSSSGDIPTLVEPRKHTPDPPVRPEHELAYKLMQKHKLQYTEEDALRLEHFIGEGQRMFDMNRSKERLCEFLARGTSEITDPDFVFAPRAEIERADELEHCGNSGKTEDAVETANSAMELNLRWLGFKGINEVNLKGQNPTSELSMERKVGHLFDELFSFDELQESANKPAQFLPHFQLFNTSPQPDYAVRPAPGEWPHWPDSLIPILASGDGKIDNSDRDSEAQIACNTRPLIILQILIYLDSRPTADAPLPGWMYNYSWIYTKVGFTVYVHYPSVKLLEDGKDWSWKMVSVLLTDDFKDVWNTRFPDKSKCHAAKATYDTMVSHTGFVLDQVRKWSRSRGQYSETSIMKQLIARAHYEEGNDDWLDEKVREEEEKKKKR